MIYLQTGNNNVVVTLNEDTTISNPQFVFVFVNDNTNKKVACTQTDISTNPDRYNKFVINVGTNAPLLGKVLFDDYGFYSLYVYETADASTFDYANINTTDLRTLTGLIEQDKAYWAAPTATINSYKDVKASTITYGE